MDPEERELPEAPEMIVPFETDAPLWWRIVATMRQGLHPTRTAWTFLQGEESPWAAFRFFLLTALPLAALQGIIPYTHTLRFEGLFQIARTEVAQEFPLHFDLLQAAGLGLATNIPGALAMVFCYASLCRAFGRREGEAGASESGDEDSSLEEDAPQREVSSYAAGIRAGLYRAWWIPMQGAFGLPAMLCVWALPAESMATVIGVLILVLSFAASVLHISGLWRAAQCSAGVGGLFTAMAVTALPFLLLAMVQGLLVGSSGLLTEFLPGSVQAMMPQP